MLPPPAPILAHHRDVETGSAHIEGHEILEARGASGGGTRDDAGGGPGQHGSDGPLDRVARGRDATVRLHDLEGTPIAVAPEFLFEIAEIRGHFGPQVRVEGGDDEPFVLTKLGIDGR
jgi:hypothetical protein